MNFRSIPKPILIACGTIIILLLWIWTSYNGLIATHETVGASWAQVETVEQRRVDLIPNLVESVKGAARFEKETLTSVTNARTKWLESGNSTEERMEAARNIDMAMTRFIATVENYPQLQATETFRDLLAQLEGTENRISVARRDYNEAVRLYNLSVKKFPGNLLAKQFGFSPETFFEAIEGAENAPRVKFE